MPTLTADLRDALRDRFRDAFGERLHRLILYGSHARGDATEYSDIDVLVVLNEAPDSSDRERAHEVMHTLREEYDAHVSPLVTSRERFDTYNQPLYRNVREEGELLVPPNNPEAESAFHHHTYPSKTGPRGMQEATEDALTRARNNPDGAWRDFEAGGYNRTVSGAYCAMLYAARAALNEAGKAPKSHQGVQHQLWETYVRDGPLDATYHRLLSEAEGERLDADCERTPSFSAEEAEQWIARAEDFVDTVEAMLLDAADDDDSAS
ncbi:MAG: HEPN domain-containing protein [Salinibacter sp.]|uniref:HEPN domain-containing protein n=1 Tax=Salinibacter sp. TaxID=2065818 RepID=UPI0035D4BA00